MTRTANPALAFLLSLVIPGLGQAYTGEHGKGVALLCVVAGVLCSAVVFASSPMTLILMGVIYVTVAIPAAIDAFKAARHVPKALRGEARWFVVVMLLVVGPFALPLLWQNQRFSRTAKIGWTALVTIIALLCVVAVAALGPFLDQIREEYNALQRTVF